MAFYPTNIVSSGGTAVEVTGINGVYATAQTQTFATGVTGYSKAAISGCTGYLTTTWGTSASYMREFSISVDSSTGVVTITLNNSGQHWMSGQPSTGVNFILYN